MSNSGTILGRVNVSGDPAGDSAVMVPATSESACGPARTLPLVQRRGERLAEVVVWLDDARSGKALPMERRFEISNSRCELVPRVQAALAGGMLQVKNADATNHRVRFTLEGAELALVRQTDPGQVVPTEKVLANPGLVEARCELHSWSRAWIHVFDHPYFAIANRDGIFTIDSVPPGTYRLNTWHAALGERRSEVVVEGGKEVKVEVGY